MFSLICAWVNGWVNNREAGDLRRYRAQYDVIVMQSPIIKIQENGIHFVSALIFKPRVRPSDSANSFRPTSRFIWNPTSITY